MNAHNWKRMRNSLSKSLDLEFADWFKKEKVDTVPRGETYVSRLSSPKVFLVYYRSNNFNAFFSDIAWSRDGKWPVYPSLTAEVDAFASMPQARFRVEQCWLAPPYTLQAWCLTKPAGLRQLDPAKDSRLDELVGDAEINFVARQYCDAIRDHIIPMVERISRFR